MDKKEVANILEEIGTLLEIKGESPFKSRAYQNGARIVKGLSDDLANLVESGEIRKIKGIGEALADKISELVRTGRLEYYEKLRSSFPDSLMELMRIPGVGPKKVKKLYEEEKITSIAELEQACHDDRIAGLEGFGRKTQEKILEGIAFVKKHSGRNLFHVAFRAGNSLLDFVKNLDGVQRAELAGSLRRCKETVKDIDIIASAAEKDRAAIMEAFVNQEDVTTIVAQGSTKSAIVLKNGIQADLRLVSDKGFPYALHHFTGSKEHNTAMRGMAKKRGIKMSEYGLFRENGDQIPCKDEQEIFAVFDMAYVAPELRENMGEIEAAQQNELPELIEKQAIKGILHCHTTYSDGANTIKEMAGRCRKMGMQYLGISDHSRTAIYANGLSIERLRQQGDEIRRLNEDLSKHNFRIFHGIECDILGDGALDYPDDVLRELDFVVISVHSRLNMSKDEATKRVVTAMQNSYVTILGHPTGRLLLDRDGYELDLDKVFATALEHDVVIEINANPHRFDLDWRYLRQAKDQGITFSINPDAHSVDGLEDTFWGIGIARKGWLTAADVLNTKSLAGIEAHFGEKHPGAG